METPNMKYYLFTLINICEDGGVNGEHENKLFTSYSMAQECMAKNINAEISAYLETHQDASKLKVERIGKDAVNLWFDENCQDGVLYSISDIRPL